MYGNNSMRNSGITQLTNYAQALAHYESVVPIRGSGSNAGKRPLGGRGKAHFQIFKHNNDAISCRLYKTDVVTFHPDNKITFNIGNYTTTTTANFIAQVLGTPCCTFNNRLVLTVNNGDYTVNQHLMLVPIGGTYHVADCEQDTVHTIDRKAMNAVRKDFTEFTKYVTGMMKMQEGKIPIAELQEPLMQEAAKLGVIAEKPYQIPRLRVNNRDDVMRVHWALDRFTELVKSGDAGNWYLSFLWLLHSSDQIWYSSTVRYTPSDVLSALNDVLIALNPHVLKPTLIERGTVKVDRYKKFTSFKE